MRQSRMNEIITPLRYGVVGLGRAGWGNHIGQLRNRPDASIVAVADSQADRCLEAKQELGCRVYANGDELLKHNQMDVVLVATPSVNHAQDTIDALNAGYHVIVEKPMAMNIEEADRMIQASRSAGKYLFVHHQHRFGAPFVFMKEVIDSGRLGRIYHIRNYISRFQRRYDWQTLTSMGGGELNNTCSHFLDQMLQLMNSPVATVMADMQRIAWVGDAEDHVKAVMRTQSGCTGDMEITNGQALSRPLPLWIVCGTHGTITIDVGTATVRWFDPKRVANIEAIPGPAANRKYVSDDLPWEEDVVDLDRVPSDTFYDNVYGVIRRGETMRITPESMRELIRVMDMISASSKAGLRSNAIGAGVKMFGV